MPRLDGHPYLLFYLVGCALVVVLSLVRITLHYSVIWITKTNVLERNLRKLKPDAVRHPWVGLAKSLGIFVVEIPLSWLNVAVISWKIVAMLLSLARDALSPVPQAVRQLRFPLKNNPDLLVESVWAYLYALGIRAGNVPPDEPGLAEAINEVFLNLPDFDRAAALRQLEALDVVKPSVIAAVVSRYTDPLPK